MAKWVHSDTLDQGPNYIKTTAIRMLLISAYAAADSYATVVGNKLAEATMASGDFTLGNGASSSRTLTTAAGKSATASATAASPNLHIAFTNNVDKVLWVTDETSDQPITSGNTVNFPSIVYTTQQPT